MKVAGCFGWKEDPLKSKTDPPPFFLTIRKVIHYRKKI